MERVEKNADNVQISDMNSAQQHFIFSLTAEAVRRAFDDPKVRKDYQKWKREKEARRETT